MRRFLGGPTGVANSRSSPHSRAQATAGFGGAFSGSRGVCLESAFDFDFVAFAAESEVERDEVKIELLRSRRMAERRIDSGVGVALLRDDFVISLSCADFAFVMSHGDFSLVFSGTFALAAPGGRGLACEEKAAENERRFGGRELFREEAAARDTGVVVVVSSAWPLRS